MAGAVGVGVGVVLLLVALIFFFFLRSRRRLSYEELPIMANKEDERGGSCDTQHDPNMAPKPLPPPSLLSDRSSRASAVQRSRLELRKLESDLLEGSDSFFPPDGSGGAPAGEQCWAAELPCASAGLPGDVKLRDPARGPAGGFVRAAGAPDR